MAATNSSIDCRFPTTVSGTDRRALTSAAFWQEIDKEKAAEEAEETEETEGSEDSEEAEEK